MEDNILKMKKEISNLKLAKQGIEAEYQYVLEKEKQKNWKLKGEVEQKQRELEDNELRFKKEFEQAVKEIDNYKRELEAIKNSKWWKLREKIKGEN
jgi:hypothetical protein